MFTDQAEMPTAAVSRGRPDLASRAVLSVLFTGVQVWAITVAVLHVPVGGAERVALAAALAAAVITVLDAWHELWTRSRRLLGRQHLVWAAATDGTPPGPR